jgi:hypothetical protein
MSFRKKLLLLFAATALVCVAVISISVYSTIRRSFEQADQDRANAVAAQFRSEFQRRGSEVARRVESVAASEAVQRIALDMNRTGADPSEYVGEARSLASQQRLDFLELVEPFSPRRNGRQNSDIPRRRFPKPRFPGHRLLKRRIPKPRRRSLPCRRDRF